MISMYKWQRVKALRANGESVKGIARKLGISKNTVRKYLKSTEPPEFKAREYESILEGHKQGIIEMLDKKFIGTRIYEELLKQDYQGSLPTVHRFIAGIKKEEEKSKKATTRIETVPGKQMQYDWKEWELIVDGKPVKIYIHELILSYSRKKYWTYSLSITSKDIMRAISQGIDYFGGVPSEILIDNPKQMVITHRKDGVIRFNDEFLKFCGLYGVEPVACKNYRARTKGKVERPFYYIQEHLLRGFEIDMLSGFGSKLDEFAVDYNARMHSSLKESPDKRFLEESSYLRNIPAIEPVVLFGRELRKVTNDGYVSFDGSFYPVPMKYCLCDVRVECVLGRVVKVYDNGGKLILESGINPFDKGIRPVHPEHEAMNKVYAEKRAQARNVHVERFVSLFGVLGEAYIAGLRQAAGANLYWHLSEILAYCEVYEVEAIRRAIKACSEIGSYHKNSVVRLLTPAGLKTSLPEASFSYPGLPKGDVSRPLSVYAGIEGVCHE